MGKSSKDKRDAYYRLAKEQGWRARSAFKLIQLDEQFNLFDGVTRVVDLCAAPGSWSQVLSRVLVNGESFGRRAWEERQQQQRLPLDSMNEAHEQKSMKVPEVGLSIQSELQPREGVKIVAVDLQPMAPLAGIISLVADITHPSTIPQILHALDPETFDPNFYDPTSKHANPVDLVISDGAPDVTGLHDLDIYVQSQLLFSALDLALRVLKPGGKFVAKIFRGKDVDLIYSQMRCFFERVHCAKPRSSRASSLEAFIVCEGFALPPGYKLDSAKPIGPSTKVPKKEAEVSTGEPFVDGQRRTTRADGITVLEFEEDEADIRWIAPFIACGDLSAWDADATYHLPKGHVVLDPVQPPTAPPYKRALELRKQQGGFYGKTKNLPSKNENKT
jgi:tRNA (cytidine32/guanosine34-2'-O)-methyltransferase